MPKFNGWHLHAATSAVRTAASFCGETKRHYGSLTFEREEDGIPFAKLHRRGTDNMGSNPAISPTIHFMQRKMCRTELKAKHET